MGRDRKKQLHKRSRSVNPTWGEMEVPSDPLIGTDAQHTLEMINSNVERMFKSFTQKHHNRKNQVLEVYFTASNGDKERLNVLLQQPDASAWVKYQKPATNNTPLHKAAQYGHPICCYMLVSAGANIDAANANGETPLHMAAMNNNVDVVEVLMQSGANPNLQTFDRGMTPLHFIAAFGYDRCLLRMYEAIEKRDAAAQKMKLTSSLGFKHPMPLYLNMTNFAGKAALHLVSEGRGALRKSNTVVGRILLQHGADVLVADKAGFTPLHCAAYFGAYATCEMLLEFGASRTEKNKNGKRAVDVMLGDISPDLNLGLVERKLLTQRMEALLCVPTTSLSTSYAAVDVSVVSAPKRRLSVTLLHSQSLHEGPVRSTKKAESPPEQTTQSETPISKRRRSSSAKDSPVTTRSRGSTLRLPITAPLVVQESQLKEPQPKDSQAKKFSPSKRQSQAEAAVKALEDGNRLADIRERTPVKTLEAPATETRHRRNSSLPQSTSPDGLVGRKVSDALVNAALASVVRSERTTSTTKKTTKDLKEQHRMQREALKLLEKEDDKIAARRLEKMQQALAQEIVLKVEYDASLGTLVGDVKYRYVSFERSMTTHEAIDFVLQGISGDGDRLSPDDFVLFLPPTERERREMPLYMSDDRLLSSYYVQAKESVVMQTRESFVAGRDLTKIFDGRGTPKKHKRTISWSKKSFLSRSGISHSPKHQSTPAEDIAEPSPLAITHPKASESATVPIAARKTLSSEKELETHIPLSKTSLEGLMSRLGEQISSASLPDAGQAEDDLVTISKKQLQAIIDAAVRLALVPAENELARAHNLQLQHSNARGHPMREIANAEGLVPSDVPGLWYPDTLDELTTMQDSSDNFLPEIVALDRRKRLLALLAHYSLDSPSDGSSDEAHRILVDFLLYGTSR